MLTLNVVSPTLPIISYILKKLYKGYKPFIILKVYYYYISAYDRGFMNFFSSNCST